MAFLSIAMLFATVEHWAAYAPAFLWFMWIWGRIDSHIMSYYASHYRPVELQPNPPFKPSDVSVIVCSLDPPPVFKACLLRWYTNNPLEIIIVTTASNAPAIQTLVNEVIHENGLDASKLSVLISPKGARVQFQAGIELAKGKIIAVSDNHIYWSKNYLEHMLAPFSDSQIGAVWPATSVYIPPERRTPQTVTVADVASARICFRSPGWAIPLWTFSQWCFILSGAAVLYRSQILKDPAFLHGYTNDSWNGKRLDAGEDTYITRWMVARDWKIMPQCKKETMVWRTVKKGGVRGVMVQWVRWERSSLQSFLRSTWEIRALWRWSNILPVVKTIERLTKSALAIPHTLAFAISLYLQPVSTSILLFLYIDRTIPVLVAFMNEYPYMWSYWWVVPLTDWVWYTLVGWWAWCTLGDDTWVSGDKDLDFVGDRQNRRVVEETKEKVGKLV